MILVSNTTKIHTSYPLKLSERPKRLSNFFYAKINQKYAFFTGMFNSLASILLLGQVLNPGGFVSDVFESYMSSHNPFESVVPSGVASTKIWGGQSV